MSNLYLPLHVWDREVDSRLVVGYLASCIGIETVIGHEYNMSPMYEIDENAILFRAGMPLDHQIRGRWHKEISKRGGIVMTQDEEGVNNMPLKIEENDGRRIVNLDIHRIKKNTYKTSVQAVQDVSNQIAWSTLHRANICHKLENIESRSIAVNNIDVCSPARFDTLGNFGALFQQRLSESMKNIYGDYLLILDNFSVDARGQKGIIDPTKDMREAGHTEQEIKDYLEEVGQNRSIEEKARGEFAELVEEIATRIPEINIVFRPHPVLDQRYWREKFSVYRNINIVDKGAIHAWIYGSMATLHSGCTTGLEAYGACKKTYDVSGLIGPRINGVKNSLISRTQQVIKERRELMISIKDVWQQYKKNERLLVSKKKNHEYKGSERVVSEGVDQAIMILKGNCSDVAKNIWQMLALDNAEDVIGSTSALSYIVEKSIHSNKSNSRSIESMVNDGYTMKIQPNNGKSRYVSELEISNRVRDIWLAFNELGAKLPLPIVESLGINLYRLKIVKENGKRQGLII